MIRKLPKMKKEPRENGAKPPILAMIGSVMAMISSGTRYACQPLRFAPANKLIAPTGARFGGCGSTRNKPPMAVRPKAVHLEGSPSCVRITLVPLYSFSLASDAAARLGSQSTSGAWSRRLTQRLQTKNAWLGRVGERRPPGGNIFLPAPGPHR